MEDIQKFRELIKKRNRIVAFTGAGISTDSGISDYRSKGGIWDRFQPIYFEEFVSNSTKRKLYWERKVELWKELRNAKPNITHFFFKQLYDSGKLLNIITQNIDGLHEKSGILKEKIIKLHGTSLEVICLDCEYIVSSEKLFKEIDLDEEIPMCPDCGGILKPNTISFGQQLNYLDLQESEESCLKCDLMIVTGTSCEVYPAASYPLIAKDNGAELIIINKGETPLDKLADIVFNEELNDFWDKYYSITKNQ